MTFFLIKGGRKKIQHMETLPSPAAQRIIPTVSEDLKKRIQAAVKSKENKGKKTVKKELAFDEEVNLQFFVV